MKKIILSSAGSLMIGALIALAPLAVFAQTSSSTASATRIAAAKTKADAEIQRRLTNLNSLSTRIGEMKNVSASEKTSLQSTISTQVASLTSLEATINAETVVANLKTEIQSITKDYRIYALVIPQGRIIAASDRVETIYADMQAIAPKLDARITAAQAAEKNVSSATAAYADMQTQIAGANTAATAAATEVASLVSDQGNTTIEASNTTALKDAASKIKTATADLKAARADISTILTAVKGTGGSGTATTSAQ